MDSRRGDAPRRSALTSGKRAVDFVGDVKGEIQKITWTSQEELVAYTKIVVAATFAAGLAIYCMDVVIQTALTGLNVFMRLITG